MSEPMATPRFDRTESHVNGIDVEDLRDYIASAEADPTVAERDQVAIARWLGAERAEVRVSSVDAPIYIGGDDEPSSMKMVLAALAACDVDVVASRAALLGIGIESLRWRPEATSTSGVTSGWRLLRARATTALPTQSASRRKVQPRISWRTFAGHASRDRPSATRSRGA